MRKLGVVFFGVLSALSYGQNDRSALQRAAASNPSDVAAATAWARYLESHGDPGARQAYEKLLALGDNAQKNAAARRLAMLDLIAGDNAAAQRHLNAYRETGGTAIALPEKTGAAKRETTVVEIPGPLRSFARMAALSPDLSPDDVLGALARNVVTNGYQAASSSEALDQTEFLKLVVRYLSQARELTKLAGDTKTIKIETCESAQTGDLLRVLGYRMRGGCGAEVVLETVNATRAFVTIDSGFPLAELEQALRTNRPFTYDYKPTQVALLYSPDYWVTAKEKEKGEFIDAFLSDPALCRLYLALSKMDAHTAAEMRKAVPVQRIKAFAHVLDFFGAMLQVKDGKVPVPGGQRSAAAWAELAGASPDQGAAFLEKLVARDDGWLASYFDSLARIHGPIEAYLTEPARLKRFYTALRGRITSPGPARPVFRANTELMLLTTRMRMDADGKPHLPGGVEMWKDLFIKHPHGKYDGKLTKAASGWKEPDDVIEALFGLSRKAVENEPLKIYMALTDLNRRRAQALTPETVNRLMREFRQFGSQYPIFAEVPALGDKTILQYIDTAQSILQIRDQALRADAAGTLQSLISLWQILLRHQTIKPEAADSTLSTLLASFTKARSNREVFDAGRTGVMLLLKETGAPANVNVHDRMMDLLAGAATPDDQESHRQIVQEMIRIYETQKLPSLKLLFDIADHAEAIPKGEKLNTALLNRLHNRLQEIQVPRASLSTVEKNSLAFGYWTERHIDGERKLNIRSQFERAGADAAKLGEIRGLLTPLLRDALVGLNYVHYAPPGAQILQTNPVFVRSHDFLGLQGSPQTWRPTEVFGTGWPSSAGGRLVGSLSGLPYALAEAEQNFLIPSREQALIWGDLVPQMIVMAKVPRFWNVTSAQLRFVGLHMRLGEELMADATLDPSHRKAVLDSLERRAVPARVRQIEGLMAQADLKGALELTTPAELFLLAADLNGSDKSLSGPIVDEIRRLASAQPDKNSYVAISRAFGTPKPTLAHSYHPELLNLRTFPTLMGYSSRIMAESWESNLLYYAAIADQAELRPSQLNVLVPEWTQKTVERIFATHLEDWPALLRSLRTVGTDVRQQASSGAPVAALRSLE